MVVVPGCGFLAAGGGGAKEGFGAAATTGVGFLAKRCELKYPLDWIVHVQGMSSKRSSSSSSAFDC